MIQSADSIRVFIALEISTEARQALAQTIRRLRAEIPHGVRWVDPTGIHRTLKFLGNIDAHLVDAIYDAMRDSAQGSALLQIRLSGLGLFPSVKRPRVLWAGRGRGFGLPRGLAQRRWNKQQPSWASSRRPGPLTPTLPWGGSRMELLPMFEAGYQPS